jgi:hypothetical protein
LALTAVNTPPSSSCTTTIFPWPDFVHLEGPTAMLLTVEGRNRHLIFLFPAHLDETEPLAPAGVPILDYVRALLSTSKLRFPTYSLLPIMISMSGYHLE